MSEYGSFKTQQNITRWRWQRFFFLFCYELNIISESNFIVSCNNSLTLWVCDIEPFSIGMDNFGHWAGHWDTDSLNIDYIWKILNYIWNSSKADEQMLPRSKRRKKKVVYEKWNKWKWCRAWRAARDYETVTYLINFYFYMLLLL